MSVLEMTSTFPDGFERITRIKLPFDRRDPDPSKNYGVGGLQAWFTLKGPKGAVFFNVGFPVYLRCVKDWWNREGLHQDYEADDIRGYCVGYHAHTPQYEGQEASDCDVLEGGKCYTDVGFCRGEDWGKEIFAPPHAGDPEKEIWRRLEQDYRERFEERA